jgi:hypothetical protein
MKHRGSVESRRPSFKKSGTRSSLAPISPLTGKPVVGESDGKSPPSNKVQVSDGDMESLAIDWDDYDMFETENKSTLLGFPASKSTGTALTLERMDYINKQVERLKTQHGGSSPSSPPISPRTPRTPGRSSKVLFESDSSQDRGQIQAQLFGDSGRNPMEDVFVQCCKPSSDSSADFRLMELLGPDMEQQLFNDQRNILEYFRYKQSVMDRTPLTKMQGMCAGDDDVLGELSGFHGEVSSPVSAPKKENKLAITIEEAPSEATDTPDSPRSPAISNSTSGDVSSPPSSPAQRRKSLATQRSSVFSVTEEGDEPKTPTSSAAKRAARLYRSKTKSMLRKSSTKDLSSADVESVVSEGGSSSAASSELMKQKLGKKGAAGRGKTNQKKQDSTLPPLTKKRNG